MTLPLLTATATSIAHPNIAFIKYWGNRDQYLRLPSSGSISMNLAGLTSTTSVHFSSKHELDALVLNGQETFGKALERVTQFLDIIRQLAGVNLRAMVTSSNNFPTGAGIASSASAFAALALASSHALRLNLNEVELSRLARRGSGSACRSVPAGFVEWLPGSSDSDSYAVSIAPPNHWRLVDLVTVVHQAHKSTGSSEGHALAETSPLNSARLAGSPNRLAQCRNAILSRDFDALGDVTELDSNLMHAVMMTSTPALFYWEPATLRLLRLIPQWRREGIPVCYTVDAGPNVHVLCLLDVEDEIKTRLTSLKCVNRVIPAVAGDAAHLVSD